MTKTFLIFITSFCLSLSSHSQITKYKIGKYKATIDLYSFTMKWEKGTTTSTLLEIETNERNVRKFNEVENGKISGSFEIYYITDGQTDGTYKRADGKEFNMKIIKVIKK